MVILSNFDPRDDLFVGANNTSLEEFVHVTYESIKASTKA
jgi:hypothetical protein